MNMTGAELAMRIREQLEVVRQERQSAAEARKGYDEYNALIAEMAEKHQTTISTFQQASRAKEAAEKRLRDLLCQAKEDAPELFDGSACTVAPGMSVRIVEKIVFTDGVQTKAWAMAHPEYLIVDERALRDMVEGSGECPPGVELVAQRQGVLAKVL